MPEFRSRELADEYRNVGGKMSERFGVQVILMLMGQEKIVDVLRKTLRSDAGFGQKMRVKPGAGVGALGKPRIGKDPLTCHVDQDASLTKIGDAHNEPRAGAGTQPIVEPAALQWIEADV